MQSSIATSVASLEAQVAAVNRFSERNFLRLNVEKCEIVMFSRDQRIKVLKCEVNGTVAVPAVDMGKCLGYWWKGGLLATQLIEENIRNARQAFFQ